MRPISYVAPAAISIPAVRQEAKFICSACGADPGCDCNAPAVEKLAEKLEQDRQRAAKYKQKKREQKQQSSHVTADHDLETKPKLKERYVSPVAAGKATLAEFYTANHVIGVLRRSIHDLRVLDFSRAASGCNAADVDGISREVECLSSLLDELRMAMRQKHEAVA